MVGQEIKLWMSSHQEIDRPKLLLVGIIEVRNGNEFMRWFSSLAFSLFFLRSIANIVYLSYKDMGCCFSFFSYFFFLK